MPLGAHMSISGGVDKAVLRGQEIGCETIQVFTRNNNRWAAPPLKDGTIENWYRNLEKTGIAPVVAHDSYLINLASPDDALWQKSLDAFVVEMERCEALSIPYLVMHPGAHTGLGEEAGLRRIAQALDRAFERVPEARVTALLETTAGAPAWATGSSTWHGLWNWQRWAIASASALTPATHWRQATKSARLGDMKTRSSDLIS